MSFCNFSSQKLASDSFKIQNIFVVDYMPYAPDNATKCYLLGLYMCNNPSLPENNLEYFCKTLSISKEDVLGCFAYWEEMQLIKMINLDPIEIKYLPVKRADKDDKALRAGKYSEFCRNIQEVITGRMISTYEYYEYINFLDSMHMEPNALLLIAQYCVTIQNDNIAYSYILAVAKKYAYKNILTFSAVENAINEDRRDDDNLKVVLNVFGIKRNPKFEEKQSWSNIIHQYGFNPICLIEIAKQLHKKKINGINALENKVQKYYSLQLFDIEDINAYESQKDLHFNTAREVTKNLGLYYENLEPVVDNYIMKWLTLGYDSELIIDLAKFCFTSSIRTLQGLDDKINKFYKLGIISKKALDEYVNEVVSVDNEIKEILNKLGLSRNVNSYDRDMYKVWTSTYNQSQELIDFAISKSIGKTQPVIYLNKLLVYYHDNNIKTVDDAKCNTFEPAGSTSTAKHKVITHSYTKQEFNSVFANLDEIDI